EGILFLAADAVFFDDVLGGDAHVVIVEGIPQAIVDHGVDHCPVTHALAVAAVGNNVGRLAHAFLAAGNHHLGVATTDCLDRHVNGLETGAANLVDGHGRHRSGYPSVDGGLARRV